MPGPALYVTIAVIGTAATVAAALAFKEFVYDTHIAPLVQEWLDERASQEQIRHRRRQPIPVAVRASPTKTKSKGGSEDFGYASGRKAPVELENLVSKEVNEWGSSDSALLRHRQQRQSSSGHVDQYTPSFMAASLSPRNASSPSYTFGSTPDVDTDELTGLMTPRSPPPNANAPSADKFTEVVFDAEGNNNASQATDVTPPRRRSSLVAASGFSPFSMGSGGSGSQAAMSPFSDPVDLSSSIVQDPLDQSIEFIPARRHTYSPSPPGSPFVDAVIESQMFSAPTREADAQTFRPSHSRTQSSISSLTAGSSLTDTDHHIGDLESGDESWDELDHEAEAQAHRP